MDRIKHFQPTARQLKDFEDSGKLPNFNPNKMIDSDNEKAAIQALISDIEKAIERYPQGYKV